MISNDAVTSRGPQAERLMRISRGFLGLLLALCIAPAARAAVVTAELVKDINTAPMGASASAPRHFRRAGDRVYFSATTPATGVELYASDGVTAELMNDFAPGTASSYPRLLGRTGTKLIIDADDGVHGEQLVALDPVSGERVTLMAFSNAGSAEQSRTGPVAQVGERVIFTSGGPPKLWGTDGTPAGTARLVPGQDEVFFTPQVCSLPDRALFVLPSGSGNMLWRSDGSAAGTTTVALLPGESNVANVAAAGTNCYFLFHFYNGWALWRSDGNSASLLALQYGGAPRGLAATPDFAYVADSGGGQFRLWRSDENSPIATYALALSYSRMYVIGDRVLFVGPYDYSGVARGGLFLSDGTAAGTQRLAAPVGFPSDLNYVSLKVIGGALVVGQGSGAWRVDPVAATIESLGTISTVFNQNDWAELGGVLIGPGSAFGGYDGEEVWRTDGMAAGTQRLHDIWQANAGAFGIDGSPTVSAGSTLFFRDVLDYQDPSRTRWSLWRTDGTADGTRPLPRAAYDEDNVVALARLGDGVVFRSDGNGRPYYRADGELAGASLIASNTFYSTLLGIGAGDGVLFSCATPTRDLCVLRPGDSLPGIVAPGLEAGGGVAGGVGSLGGVALFYVDEPSGAGDTRGLWRSDGTGPGTYRIVPDLLSRSSSYPNVSLVFGGRLLFDGCIAGGTQCGLHASDGTAAGTQLIALLPARIRAMTAFGNRVALMTGVTVSQLWISDGSTAGTELLRAFQNWTTAGPVTVGDRVHFIVAAGAGSGYYVSDGSKGGTAPIGLPAQMGSNADFLVPLDGDTALFRCFTPQTGGEICAVDADGDDVRLVRDIFPGADSSLMRPLGSTASAAYFAADDGYHGMELWRVQGRGDALFANGFE
jgi:ELWxxDGT repeat protein